MTSELIRPLKSRVEVRTTSLVVDGVRVPGSDLCDDPRGFTEPFLVGSTWRDAAFGMQRRVWRERSKTHNLRLNVGRDQQQRIAMFGDFGTGLNALAATGTATAATATTYTAAASSFPTATSAAGNAGLQGHLVFVADSIASFAFVNPVIGVILSNTATVLTIDQWSAVPITGAVGTTPTTTAAAPLILPSLAAMRWAGLSTSAAAAAATDVTRTTDGLWGDGTGGGAATEQTANGLARAYIGHGSSTAPTISGAGNYTFAHTWTYSGSSLVTIPKIVLFNSAAGAGTIPMLETLLSAQATVNANGDTIVLSSWSITL